MVWPADAGRALSLNQWERINDPLTILARIWCVSRLPPDREPTSRLPMYLGTDTPGTRDLCGVAKTLRHIYVPILEPDAAIARALEALARLERPAARRFPRTRREFARVA